MGQSRVFLITGCSSGFGNALTQKCLSSGDKVAATSRNPDQLKFFNATAQNFLAVDVDLSSLESIQAAFDKTIAAFGCVDVVVNNAGFGLCGAFEELTDQDIQSVMNVNFMGVIRVTRMALHVMREINKPPGGLIQQITSIAGQCGMPAMSAYCASKWAVEGLTESIARELDPQWNIHLTCIEPGGFRSEWAHKNMQYRHPDQILPAYGHIVAEQVMSAMEKEQAGDCVKGAAAIHQLAYMHNPPLRCPLGSEAFGVMESKLKGYNESYREFQNIALPVDLDG